MRWPFVLAAGVIVTGTTLPATERAAETSHEDRSNRSATTPTVGQSLRDPRGAGERQLVMKRGAPRDIPRFQGDATIQHPIDTSQADVPTGVMLLLPSKAKISPSLSLTVKDLNGNTLYSNDVITNEALIERGPFYYATSVRDARQTERTGARPVTLEVVHVGENDTLYLSDKSADLIKNEYVPADVLAEARVAVVLRE